MSKPLADIVTAAEALLRDVQEVVTRLNRTNPNGRRRVVMKHLELAISDAKRLLEVNE